MAEDMMAAFECSADEIYSGSDRVPTHQRPSQRFGFIDLGRVFLELAGPAEIRIC